MSKRARLCVRLRSSTLLTTGLLGLAGSAQAQDATWLLNPATGNWNTATNWSPATVPTGTASFATSTRTGISFSNAFTSVGTIQFNPAASAYTFTIGGPAFRQLNLTGTGIVNNSGVTQNFNVNPNGALGFSNAATAGSNVRITATDGSISFNNASTAGSAVITANGSTSGTGGFVAFANTSSAADSSIAVNQSSFVQFSQTATAGNAAITLANTSGPNDFPFLFFTNASTAGNATIVSTGSNVPLAFDSGIEFINTSSAGTARITNNANSFTAFFNNSTAANAAILNNGSPTDPNFFGLTQFSNTASAGNASITNNLGETDFFQNTTAGTATIRNIGISAAALANNIFGATFFGGSSTAGNATIINDAFAGTFFQTSATGGNATIITNADGFTRFSQNATGGNARFITNAGGTVDFSRVISGGVTAGSIEGGGNYYLGPNRLTVGSNNLSTEVTGTISDCGPTGAECRAVIGTPALSSSGGGLTKVGTGTLTLSGSNTYTGGTTISGGTLQLGNGGASGSILGNVVDNATFAINRSDLFTFGGLISGTGSLRQIGSGTTVLTAANTFTGLTTVENGGLLVSGSLAGPVNVFSGATLGGTGSVGSTTVNGTLSPGPSIGTFTVNGNLTVNSGATYLVEASPSAADRTNATGTATLNGGTVQVVAQPVLYPLSTTYTILNAAGGRSGTFGGVTDNSVFLDSSLSYTPTSVLLTLARIPFGSFGQTPNQVSVGNALDLGGGPLALLLFQQNSIANVPPALQALSGEIHASVQSPLVDDSRYVRNAVLGRLRQAPYVDASNAMAALGFAGPALAQQSEAGQLLAYRDPKSPFAVKAAPVAPVPVPATTFWGQGYGAWGHFDGDGNAAHLTRDLGGFVVGADRRVGDNWLAGIAAGYSHANVNIAARANSAAVDSAHIAAYAGSSYGAINLRGGAAYAWHDIDTTRAILFPGFADAARASYNGRTAQVFGEAGYALAYGNVALEPFAGLAWVSLHTGSFAEIGGPAALSSAGSNEDVGYSTLGVRAAATWVLANGMALVPRASAAWQHAFNDLTPAVALAFSNTGAPFVVTGVPLARDGAQVEAGLDLRVNPRTTLGVSYVGYLADRAESHAINGKFSWKF